MKKNVILQIKIVVNQPKINYTDKFHNSIEKIILFF